jgi:hypothetical protein
MEWYPYGSAVLKARLGDFLGSGGGRHWLGRAVAARTGRHMGSQALDFQIEAVLKLSADA